MNSIRKFLITNANFSGLIFLPYWILVIPRIVDSDLFSWGKALLILGLFCAISIALIKYSPGKNIFYQFINTALFALIISFFYGNIAYDFVQPKLAGYLGIELRGRVLLPVILIVVFLLKFYLTRTVSNFNLWFNRITFVFCLVLILGNFNEYIHKPKFQPNRIHPHLPAHETIKKYSARTPILLIVLDEYQDPLSIAKYIPPNKAFEFVKYLKDKGWTTKPAFQTFEAGTIHSISSMFNYNLSTNQSNYGYRSIFFADSTLRSAQLIKNLEEKNIEFFNYSFFRVGNKPEWFKLYSLPKSFIELFLQISLLPKLDIATKGYNPKNLNASYSTSSEYNQNLLGELKGILNNGRKNSFYYSHLYMPHSPIIFGKEMNSLKYDVSNYANYWQFVNHKIMDLLNNTSYRNKIKIIITGDHGFRSDPQINPYHTFAAFYGFNKNEIEQLESVQDIGKLIESNF